MHKTAIFDLDGTLADTFLSIAITCNQSLQESGLPALNYQFYKDHIGIGLKKLIQCAITEAGGILETYYDRVLSHYIKKFEQNYTYKIKPYPYMVTSLEILKSRGIHLCVLTNKSVKHAKGVIECLFQNSTFELIIAQDEHFPLKPHPRGALYIANKFKCRPEECVIIGDSEVDIQTGKNAGMYTVGVLWGFRSREKLEICQPDKLIESPVELLNLFP